MKFTMQKNTADGEASTLVVVLILSQALLYRMSKRYIQEVWWETRLKVGLDCHKSDPWFVTGNFYMGFNAFLLYFLKRFCANIKTD